MQRAYFKTLSIILVCLTLLISGTAWATTTSPNDAALAGQTGPYAVSSGAVNVRGGPGTGFWIIGNLALNEIVPIQFVSPDYGWWYITTPFGEGWVANLGVTAYNTAGVPVYDPGPIGVVTAGALHVRYGAGANAVSLGRLGMGEQVFVLGQNATGEWLQIRWAYGVGWVTSRYVSLNGIVGFVDGQGGQFNESTPANLAVTADSPYVIVNVTYLNVRTGPGINYAVVGQVYAGDALAIVGRNTDSSWYEVDTTVGRGWVYAGYVVTRNEFGGTTVTSNAVGDAQVTGPIGVINTGALNARTGPGPQYTTAFVLSGGTEAQIVGRNADWSWWLLDTPWGSGWVYAIYVLVRGDTSSVPYVAPNTTVAPSSGVAGAQAPEAVVALPVAVVSTGALHIRSGPNNVFPSIGVVYGGDRMNIEGQSLDRGWWYVASPYGYGYVSKLYVITNGDTSTVPVVQ